MIADRTSDFRLGEFHEFEGAGKRFLYLVPAGAIFEVDEAPSVLAELSRTAVCRTMSWSAAGGARDSHVDDASELRRRTGACPA